MLSKVYVARAKKVHTHRFNASNKAAIHESVKKTPKMTMILDVIVALICLLWFHVPQHSLIEQLTGTVLSWFCIKEVQSGWSLQLIVYFAFLYAQAMSTTFVYIPHTHTPSWWFIHVYTNLCVHVHVHTHKHTHTFWFTNPYACVYFHEHNLCVHVHIYTHTQTPSCWFTHPYAYVYFHEHTLCVHAHEGVAVINMTFIYAIA